MNSNVTFIKGDVFNDHRGSLNYINDFSFTDVKRFYQITHQNIDIVRAWQGHKIEKKYFYVTQGTFLLAWVQIDNWVQPSDDLKPDYCILSANKPLIVVVPPGYANGMKALTEGASMMIFSNCNIAESMADKFIFDAYKWFNWNVIL